MLFGCPACPAFGLVTDVTTNVCTGVLNNCVCEYTPSAYPAPALVIVPDGVEVPAVTIVASAPEPLPPVRGTFV